MTNKLSQYVKDSCDELKKVVWPSKKQVYRHTILVIVFCLILAVFLGFIDYLSSQGLQTLIK